jgi:dihydroorotase-like cyclic amidohydrolase
MIISAPEFRDPRSFRTEAYARSSRSAAAAAVTWLGQQPLTNPTIMTTTVERVPAPEGNF